jgi:DNA-directed RNA polymerase alpha subunit
MVVLTVVKELRFALMQILLWEDALTQFATAVKIRAKDQLAMSVEIMPDYWTVFVRA